MNLIRFWKSDLLIFFPSFEKILLRLMFLLWRFMRKLVMIKVIFVVSYFLKLSINLPPKISWLNTLCQSKRFSSSISRQPRMKSFIEFGISICYGNVTFLVNTSFLNSCTFFSLMFQGFLPKSISYTITPSDQMSHLKVYCCLLNT